MRLIIVMAALLFTAVACDSSNDETDVQADCEGTVAFPVVVDNSAMMDLFAEKIADLDLSQSTDQEPCGEYAVERAEEMLVEAAVHAGYPEAELVEFDARKVMSTGSGSSEPTCFSFEVQIIRHICDSPIYCWPDSRLSASWWPDGSLKEVEGGGGGLLDYEGPVKQCDTTSWTLETCGGIFASVGEYFFEFTEDGKTLVKAMGALCESNDGYYVVPLCDDFLPDGQSNDVCGVDFCQ